MSRYRNALRTVVATEAKAYGYTIVVWSSGSLLLIERGKPTAPAVLVFVAALLLSQAAAALVAFGSPATTWRNPTEREYAWTTFHAVPVIAGVLSAWALAAGVHGMWAYLLAPLAAALAYQLLLGLESMLLSAEESASRSD